MQYSEPESLDELRNRIGLNDSRIRTKFAVKILLVLQYTKKHPETIKQLGAVWCSDGKHFLINTSVLSNFINIKPNSINTNFRDHGFKIIANTTADLRREFPDIGETRNWKKRIIENFCFTCESTISDAEKIPCLEARVKEIPTSYQNPVIKAPPITAQEIPSSANPAARDFPFFCQSDLQLLGQDHKQLLSAAKVMFSLEVISSDSSWSHNIAHKAIEIWKLISSPSYALNLPIDTVCAALDKSGNINVQTNLRFLLSDHDDNSQLNEYVSFDSFLRLFIRYGSIEDPIETIREISCQDSESQLFDFTSNPSSFVSWFTPNSDKFYALQRLNPTNNELWIALPSKTPNLFSLLCKTRSGEMALHIGHDPIAEKSKRFSVEFSNGPQYAPTFLSLLTDVIHLDLSHSVHHLVNVPTKPRYVTADVIANRENVETFSQSMSQFGDSQTPFTSYPDFS